MRENEIRRQILSARMGMELLTFLLMPQRPTAAVIQDTADMFRAALRAAGGSPDCGLGQRPPRVIQAGSVASAGPWSIAGNGAVDAPAGDPRTEFGECYANDTCMMDKNCRLYRECYTVER